MEVEAEGKEIKEMLKDREEKCEEFRGREKNVSCEKLQFEEERKEKKTLHFAVNKIKKDSKESKLPRKRIKSGDKGE